MTATYHVLNQGVAFASAKSLTDIFQTSSGTNTIRLYRSFLFNNGTNTVPGVLTTIVLRHQNTNATGGTSTTIVKHKSSDSTPGAQISAGTNRTISAGVTVRRIVWSNDEPAVSTSTLDEWELLVPNCEIWNSGYGDSNVEPLTMVPSTAEGIDLQQSGSSAVGSCDVEFEFTIS